MMMNKKYAVSPNLFNLWPSSILVYGVENTFGCPVPPDSKMIPLKSTPAAGLKRSDHTPFRNNAPSITLFCRMPGLPPTCQLSHHVLQPDQSFATRPRSTTRSSYSLAACASPRLVLPPMSSILGVGSLPIPSPTSDIQTPTGGSPLRYVGRSPSQLRSGSILPSPRVRSFSDTH